MSGHDNATSTVSQGGSDGSAAPAASGGRAGGNAPALPRFAVGVAVVLLLVYLVFAFLLWRDADLQELTFARRAHILSGLEALAFAAAGALLGTTVQRQVTTKAEKEAETARADSARHAARAEAQARDAEKGRALQRSIEAKIGAQHEELIRGEGGAVPQELLDLQALAARYDQ